MGVQKDRIHCQAADQGRLTGSVVLKSVREQGGDQWPDGMGRWEVLRMSIGMASILTGRLLVRSSTESTCHRCMMAYRNVSLGRGSSSNTEMEPACLVQERGSWTRVCFHIPSPREGIANPVLPLINFSQLSIQPINCGSSRELSTIVESMTKPSSITSWVPRRKAFSTEALDQAASARLLGTQWTLREKCPKKGTSVLE